MRVIAGKARRLQLKTITGLDTRPTTDRTKETLFNIINNNIPNSTFLDLFSGSGAIGIEALSRGAKEVYFVENNKAAVQCIRENLKFTKLEKDAVVFQGSVLKAIKTMEDEGKYFDFVFMDPPYNHLYEKDVLIFLGKSDLIDKSSSIIVEASLETDFSFAKKIGFEVIREKKYKTNKHVFLRLNGD